MKAKTTQLSITIKMFITFLTFITLTTFSAFAQSGGVVISTNPDTTADPSAILDVQSINQGVLVPRMTLSQIQAIANPATGLLVFCTDDNNYYYFNGSQWISLYNHYNNDVLLYKVFPADIIKDSFTIEEPYTYNSDTSFLEFSQGTEQGKRLISYQLFPNGYFTGNEKLLVEISLNRQCLTGDCDLQFGISDGNYVCLYVLRDAYNANNNGASVLSFGLSGNTFTNTAGIIERGKYVLNSAKVYFYINGGKLFVYDNTPNGITGYYPYDIDISNGINLEVYRNDPGEGYHIYSITVKVTRLR